MGFLPVIYQNIRNCYFVKYRWAVEKNSSLTVLEKTFFERVFAICF